MEKTTRLIILIVFLSFVTAFFFLPLMPDKMATHWNAQGAVNGYMPRAWGLFGTPVMMILVTLLMFLLPKIDPKKKNIEQFSQTFEWFIVVLDLFFFYISALVIIWNLGYEFNMTLFLIPALAVLFYFTGFMVGKAKMNYTIGIRLPWTLADERVWDKTHKLGEKLFKLSAVIMLLSLLAPNYAIWILLVSLTAVFLYLAIYSFIEFKKING